MNKRTIALSAEQYKEIIQTMKQGFSGCRPNERIAGALMLEANLGLRKFYATEIYTKNGYNIVLVQKLLQHSSAAVTQAYIGIQQRELEQAIENHLCLDV